MKFWTYSGSDSNNVLIIDENSLLVGSADKDHIKSVRQQLESGKTAAEVLGSADLTVVPFIQIQTIHSRNTDKDLNVKYKGKKETHHFDYYFDNETDAEECLEYLNTVLPKQLVHKTTQQSALSASIWPMVSLLVCLGVSFLFFDKLRWVVYIVGGIWAAFSLFSLHNRITNPPTLTSWVIKGKHVRKAWNGLKMAGSYAAIAAFATGLSFSLPDTHGEKVLYDQMWEETLEVGQIDKFLSRGADINYTDSEGYSALMMAIDWSHYDVAEALVNAGADLGPNDQETSMLEYALYDGAPDNVIKAILKKGGLAIAEQNGFDLEQFVVEYDDESLYALIDEQ